MRAEAEWLLSLRLLTRRLEGEEAKAATARPRRLRQNREGTAERGVRPAMDRSPTFSAIG